MPQTFSKADRPPEGGLSNVMDCERSSSFLFHRHGDVGIGRKADLVAFDFRDQAAVDEMMVALVLALAAVFFGQFDAFPFNPVNSADVCAVGADDLHMLLDLAQVGHGALRCCFTANV